MPAIRTLNLMYERRIRGTYPVSRYALDNGGNLTLAVPRPLEVRSYDLTRVSPQGDIETRVTFSVETLQELEVSAHSDNFLGMTVDDVYLFHDGSKGRFLEGKRFCCVDTALSSEGQTFLAGFSDMAGASYAVALGSMDGRVIWTRQVETPLSKVEMARNGERMAIATESGVISVIDSGMRTLYDFLQDETVVALACSSDGLSVSYGTIGGLIGLIDGSGKRVWEVRLPGTITTLALSGDGALCAALVQIGENIHLYCLFGQGQIGWEHALDKRYLGLSLSENGQWLAIGAKDGTTALYEIVQSEWGESDGDNNERLRQFLEQYPVLTPDRAGIALYRDMRELLRQPISYQNLHAQAEERRMDWIAACQEQVKQYAEAGEFEVALQLLQDAGEADEFARFTSEIWLLSLRHADTLRAEAQRLIQADEIVAAESILRKLLSFYPFDREAHIILSNLKRTDAMAADNEADTLLSQGDLENGIAALERAQTAHPTAERAEKIGRARTAWEFAVGMERYNERRYQEAIFQFKKVLVSDPDHAEAQRYLGFAQSFLSDASTSSLTDRFSMLE